MKAICIDKYGTPDDLELREVEKPAPGDDEVLVRVRAASLHPDVWHVVVGKPYILRLMGGGFLRPKTTIPGTDMAGVVESVGRNVTRFRPGDPVFGETVLKHQWAHGGAFAEYVTVHQDLLAVKPGNVSFEQAASVPSSGFIVVNNLRGAPEWAPGRKVLINGAGGGVGLLALQILKSHGAHVTGVDTTSKMELLTSAGADEVIDFTQEDFAQRGVLYDLIFDIPGDQGFHHFRPALEPDGRYLPVGHDSFGKLGRSAFGLIPYYFWLLFMSRFYGRLRGSGFPAPTKREATEALRDYMAAGTITPVIDSTYRFEKVHEAFRHMIEDETHGKVILTPSPGD